MLCVLQTVWLVYVTVPLHNRLLNSCTCLHASQCIMHNVSCTMYHAQCQCHAHCIMHIVTQLWSFMRRFWKWLGWTRSVGSCVLQNTVNVGLAEACPNYTQSFHDPFLHHVVYRKSFNWGASLMKAPLGLKIFFLLQRGCSLGYFYFLRGLFQLDPFLHFCISKWQQWLSFCYIYLRFCKLQLGLQCWNDW